MSAAYVLAAAAAMPTGEELLWSNDDVRQYLAKLADGLEPGDIVDQQMVERIPLTGPHLAEAIGRHMFRAEAVTSDYERCVQVAQLFGDCANRLDVKPDRARAALLREFAHSVSMAGNAAKSASEERSQRVQNPVDHRDHDQQQDDLSRSDIAEHMPSVNRARVSGGDQ